MLAAFAALGILQPATRLLPPTTSPHPVMLSLAQRAAPLTNEAWIGQLDLEAFGTDVRELGRKLKAGEGEADLLHLRKLQRW